MKNFPMFLRLEDRRVVVFGTEEEAARKVRLMLGTCAEIVVVGGSLDPELDELAQTGRIVHQSAADETTLDRAALVFVATGDAAADAALARDLRGKGVVVSVDGQPDISDAVTPSIVDRSPLVVAIGTEGQAPALARKLKADLEVQLSPQTGRFVALLGRLRSAVTEAFPARQRRDFWRWAATGPAYLAHMAGREREAASVLKQAIADRATPEVEGHIALVGAGPGAKDLLTLRAMRHLEEADVIFYDRLVDPEIVALGAPEAERIYVGKAVGANAWPQDKIDRLIVAEARKGRRVVRLKSGDPSIFGRAGEEIEAARAAGISIEIVPGITAASAAAASLLRPLTERGETDTFAISTGRAKPGDADPERGRLAVPGTSMAFYMAVEKAGHVRADLMAAGAPAACPVDIVSHASTARERHVTTTLGALEQTIRDEAVQSPAIVFVRYPKSLAAQQAQALRA